MTTDYVLTRADSIVKILPGGRALVAVLGNEPGGPPCTRCGKALAFGLVTRIAIDTRRSELVGACCELIGD